MVRVYGPLAMITLLIGGCGTSILAMPGSLRLGDTVAALNVSSGVIVVDWTGGTTAMYPGRELSPVDLSAFDLIGGGTLESEAPVFRDRVRRRMQEILNGLDAFELEVVNGEAGQLATAATTVLMTMDLSPDGAKEIGRAEYDPCNRLSDNSAVIFGEQIYQLSDPCTLDEWITIFANVGAHEVAHTLGFGHITRGTYQPPERSLFIEIMLDNHTMAEMRQRQRFIEPMDYCADESGDIEELGAGVWCRSDPH